MGLCDMRMAPMYVTHAWPVFCECVSLWSLAGEWVMVKEHSVSVRDCLTISPELMGKAAPSGLRGRGWRRGRNLFKF